MMTTKTRRSIAIVAAVVIGLPVLFTSRVAQAEGEVDWSGPYIGAHGGYTMGELSSSLLRSSSNSSMHFDLDTVSGGLYGGYNFQVADHWLLGIEVNGTYGSAEETKHYDRDTVDQPVQMETDGDLALVGRVGYIHKQCLWYLSGGFAVTELEVKNTDLDSGVIDPSDSEEESDVLTGWTLGVGYEHMVHENVIVRLDYMYTDYGKETFFRGSSAAGNFPTEVDYDESTIRVGLSWKF